MRTITSPGCLKNCVVMCFVSSIRPTIPTVGVGSIVAGGTFVVEADVPAGDRRIERAARFGHTLDGLAKLEKIFRLVRVSEIEIVGDGERHGSRTGEIARGLGDSDLCAFARILATIEPIAIRSGSKDLAGFAHEEDGGVRTGQDSAAEAHHVVVLAPDPALRSDTRMRQQLGSSEARTSTSGTEAISSWLPERAARLLPDDRSAPRPRAREPESQPPSFRFP